MERARVSWTDERLDDLARRLDAGFTRVDQDIRSVSDRIDAVNARMDEGFQAMNSRLDAINRTMAQFGGGLSIGLLAMVVTIVAQG
jgi:hypothetical protein